MIEPRKAVWTLAALTLLVLAGCGQTTSSSTVDIFDPFEDENRETHQLNLALDRAIVRPVGVGYSKFLPDEIETSIGNFADNLDLPGVVVNNYLQGNFEGVFTNSLRFAVNSTVGLGGFFDPAGEFGIHEISGDFGQTLHVWGVGEGAYVELPVLGPSTERDVLGLAVDLFTNPLGYVLPSPEKYVGVGAGVASRLGDRGRFAGAVDSVLYESADSYAQARQLYLTRRRAELGQGDAATEVDPFALDTEGF